VLEDQVEHANDHRKADEKNDAEYPAKHLEHRTSLFLPPGNVDVMQ
jgi:hypothetical protein